MLRYNNRESEWAIITAKAMNKYTKEQQQQKNMQNAFHLYFKWKNIFFSFYFIFFPSVNTKR